MIEQENFFNNTYYNAFRMITMGLDAVIKLRAMIYILALLKALTAYKVGQPDLVMKASTFESSRYLNLRVALPKLAKDSGFLIFKDEK